MERCATSVTVVQDASFFVVSPLVNMCEHSLAVLVLYLQCTLCACGLCGGFSPCFVSLSTLLHSVATFSLGPLSMSALFSF